MYYANEKFINAMLSSYKKVHIKLELFDSNMTYLREISQQVYEDLGSLTINGDSPIRRSFNLRLDNTKNEYLFGETNLVWIDKRIKLYLGLELYNQTIEYIPLGLFVLTEPSNTHNSSGKYTEIHAVDKAYFMTDKRGKFVNELTIATGTKVTDAIRIIAEDVGESMFNFDNVTSTVPYELTYTGEDNRWKALQELADLAQCTIFYDVDGYLRLKQIDLNSFELEPITWEYKYGSPDEKLYAGNIRKFSDRNLANHIRVLGGSSQTAEVIYDLVVDENDPTYGYLWTDSPYTINKIGRYTYFHNNNQPDGLITTTEEAKWRAKYELMNRLGFVEDVQISISPNYLHDADDVIYIEDKENGIDGEKYLVKSISLPLSPSQMTMDVVRYRKILDDWNFI